MDPIRAETYLRLLAESELREPASSSRRDPRAERIWLAATALVAAGAIDAEPAQRALADFERAAAVRRGGAAGMYGRPHHFPPPRAMSQLGGSPAGPRTRLFAVPVGATLPLPAEREGWYGEFRLLAFLIADGHATLTAATRWAGRTRRSAPERPPRAPSYEVGAVDDQGGSYQVSMWHMGSDDGEWWDCCLELSPAPSAAIRWLDIGPGAVGAHIRIDLAAQLTPAEVTAEPAPSASPAARLLDRTAEALLSAGRSASMTGVSQRVAVVVQAMQAGAAVPGDEPALARLAALGSAPGLDLGVPDAGQAFVPEAWDSIMAARGACDGPEAVAPFAVTLPELDGADFALAGLRSSAEGATLHVMARRWRPVGWGWPASGGRLDNVPPHPALSWQACDSTGRWHMVERVNWAGESITQSQAHLTPPLHPAATSLEVIITGSSSRVRATVPLHWQASR